MNNCADCINRIQDTAKKQGITMKYLCELLNKRRSFLSEVRNGKDKLDDDELAVIAHALHTTSEYLRGNTDDPSLPDIDVTTNIRYDALMAINSLFAEKNDPSSQGMLVRLMGKLAQCDPEVQNAILRMLDMSVEDLLKIEKIIDMMKEGK